MLCFQKPTTYTPHTPPHFSLRSLARNTSVKCYFLGIKHSWEHYACIDENLSSPVSSWS